MKARSLILLALVFFSKVLFAQTATPDTVVFASGSLHLRGLLWKPLGKGPFPAVLYNHGSEAHPEKFVSGTSKIFLEHGYAFFAPFRRGQGLSIGQGKYIIDEADSASSVGGSDARLSLIINRLETSQLDDQLAAMKFLQSQPGIDANRIAIIGISFGGIQTMQMASHHTNIKAALNFAGAAMIWNKSPKIGEWMKQMIKDVNVPVYFIQAENDFNIQPSIVLAEEMKRLGKPYELKIYPPRGTTAMQGHTFIDEVNIWAPDVFPWLDKIVSKK